MMEENYPVFNSICWRSICRSWAVGLREQGVQVWNHQRIPQDVFRLIDVHLSSDLVGAKNSIEATGRLFLSQLPSAKRTHLPHANHKDILNESPMTSSGSLPAKYLRLQGSKFHWDWYL